MFKNFSLIAISLFTLSHATASEFKPVDFRETVNTLFYSLPGGDEEVIGDDQGKPCKMRIRRLERIPGGITVEIVPSRGPTTAIQLSSSRQKIYKSEGSSETRYFIVDPVTRVKSQIVFQTFENVTDFNMILIPGNGKPATRCSYQE